MGTIRCHHPLQDQITCKSHREFDVLQDTLKDGPTRFVIQGLTRRSESYEDTIKCLKERYNCPWLVQEEHIRSIVDVAFVKNGSNKELCHLYDAVIQYY